MRARKIFTAGIRPQAGFGAEVTGVCSTSNVKLVRALGADKVIDYTQEDFTRNDETYDLILNTNGAVSFVQCEASLKPVSPTLNGGKL